MPKSLGFLSCLFSLLVQLILIVSLHATDAHTAQLSARALDERSPTRYETGKIGDFTGVNDGEEASDSELPLNPPLTMLRESQRSKRLMALGTNSLASSSSSMSASSSPSYSTCKEFCDQHVRQCNRICLGFGTQFRGMCRAHCRTRGRACPGECAKGR